MEEAKGLHLFLKGPFLVFLFLIPLIIFIFRFILDFNGLYGQDAHEYLRYESALRDHWLGGAEPGTFFWPTLYPTAGAFLHLMLGPAISLQLISILAFCGSLYFIYKCIAERGADKKNALVYVLVFGALSSYFLRLGVVVMSDMLAIFFICGGSFYAMRYANKEKMPSLLPAILFFFFAFLARFASFLVIVPPVLFLFYLLIRANAWRKIIFICSGTALSFLILHFISPSYFSNALSHPLLEGWSLKNYFLSEFDHAGDGVQQYHFINIINALSVLIHPGFILAAPILIFFIRKTDLAGENVFLLVLPVLIYIFFMAGLPEQNTRLLTMIFPFLLVFYFPAFERLRERSLFTKKYFSILVSCTLIVQAALFYFAFDDFIYQNRLERRITSYINLHYAKWQLYTSGMEGALHTYQTMNDIHSLNSEKVRGCDPSIVLIQTKQLEIQWKDQLAGSNWEELKRNCSVKKIVSFEKGWDLYETK